MSTIALPQRDLPQRAKSRATFFSSRPFKIVKLTAFYGVLGAVGAVFMVPYLFAFIGSLKPDSGIYGTTPWDFPAHPLWANYPDTWGNWSVVETHFSTYFYNTLFVTVCLTVGQVFFSMLAAYAFARLRFPGRDTIFWLYLLTLMVPNIVTIIPLYTIMDKLHGVNTYWAVFLPYALGTPYTIFLMRQFFRGIPQEVVDAAKIDGCGDLGVLRRIIIPLSRPDPDYGGIDRLRVQLEQLPVAARHRGQPEPLPADDGSCQFLDRSRHRAIPQHIASRRNDNAPAHAGGFHNLQPVHHPLDPAVTGPLVTSQFETKPMKH